MKDELAPQVDSESIPIVAFHTQPYDFGGILRFIEGVNHLPEGVLGFADKRSSTELSAFVTKNSGRLRKNQP